MATKVKVRRQPHNIGTHEERMVKRRMLQRNRQATVRVDIGKYIPILEDRKHWNSTREE